MDGSITAADLAPGSVGTLQLASGAVSQTNLAPRQVGTPVGLGGVALSSAVTWTNPSSASRNDVPNLTVTITTTGRPVFVGLVAGPSASSMVEIAGGYVSDVGVGGAAVIYFLRGTDAIASPYIRAVHEGTSAGSSVRMDLPASAFCTIDRPPAGTWTYKVQCLSPYTLLFSNVRLVAYEL